MINLHSLLLDKIELGKYSTCMTHVKGILIVTFEALLQTISTQIFLYSLADNEAYNQRAISSLAVESFSSDLSRAEFTPTGCPKACKIEKLISVVMEINTHKHNPHKIFSMDSQRCAPYAVHKLETENDNSYQGFRCHPFDSKVISHKCRIKFRPTVLKPNESQRGTHNVRSGIYTVDESKLDDLL